LVGPQLGESWDAGSILRFTRFSMPLLVGNVFRKEGMKRNDNSLKIDSNNTKARG